MWLCLFVLPSSSSSSFFLLRGARWGRRIKQERKTESEQNVLILSCIFFVCLFVCLFFVNPPAANKKKLGVNNGLRRWAIGKNPCEQEFLCVAKVDWKNLSGCTSTWSCQEPRIIFRIILKPELKSSMSRKACVLAGLMIFLSFANAKLSFANTFGDHMVWYQTIIALLTAIFCGKKLYI